MVDDDNGFANSNSCALIADMDDESIAKIFCFRAFADNNTGAVNNDCTGEFSFMSLDGIVCFL
jgi:hypothetical protein